MAGHITRPQYALAPRPLTTRSSPHPGLTSRHITPHRLCSSACTLLCTFVLRALSARPSPHLGPVSRHSVRCLRVPTIGTCKPHLGLTPRRVTLRLSTMGLRFRHAQALIFGLSSSKAHCSTVVPRVYLHITLCIYSTCSIGTLKPSSRAYIQDTDISLHLGAVCPLDTLKPSSRAYIQGCTRHITLRLV